MNRWLRRTKEFLREHGSAVLVTQLSVEGSAPREAGVKMLVSETALAGTIGGGNLEYIAIGQARKLLKQSDLDYVIQDYPLGPLLAQCCGGHVRLLLESLNRSDLSWLEEAETQLCMAGSVLLQTSFENGRIRKDAIPKSHFPELSFERPILSLGPEGARLAGARPGTSDIGQTIELIEGRAPVLFVFGAGHVGRALINVLASTAFEISWFDSRECLTGDHVANIPIRHLHDISSVVGEAPQGAFFLVFTHSHDEDYKLLETVLGRADAAFCGLIGSATKRTRFLKRLSQCVMPDDYLAPFVCPIGLSELKSKEPAVIAVGVAAQLLSIIDPVAANGGALTPTANL